MKELIVDNFAGGGGASKGIELALGRPIDIAINHDIDAIRAHKANHPKTKHYCESVWEVDPIKACAGRPVGYAWFSPDCTHHSKARGGKPVDKGIRGLAWVAVKWAALVPVRVLMLENVEEFQKWCPVIDNIPDKELSGAIFEGFKLALTTGLPRDHVAWEDMILALGEDFSHLQQIEDGLGYILDHDVLKAHEYGVGTTRKRFFLVARNDGKQVGWPAITHGEGLKPYKTAGEIINWKYPSRSIFNRKKPLADNTMKRIMKGIKKFIIDEPEPFIVRIGHTGFAGDNLQYSLDIPLTTITSKAEHCLVEFKLGKNISPEVHAFIIKYYGCMDGQHLSMNEPLHTIMGKDRFGLVTVLMAMDKVVDIHFRMLQPTELSAAHGFGEDYIIDRDFEGKAMTKKSQVARIGNSVPPEMARLITQSNL